MNWYIKYLFNLNIIEIYFFFNSEEFFRTHLSQENPTEKLKLHRWKENQYTFFSSGETSVNKYVCYRAEGKIY